MAIAGYPHTSARPPLRSLAAAAAALSVTLVVCLAALVARPGPVAAMAMALAAVTVVAATRMGRRSAAAVSLGAVAVGGVVCAAAWPALAVTLAVVLVVTGLALRAPAAAFVVALGLAGAEGLLKARLSIEHVPSAVEGGALVLDLVLAVAAVALLVRDRGRSLRAVVRGGGEPS